MFNVDEDDEIWYDSKGNMSDCLVICLVAGWCVRYHDKHNRLQRLKITFVGLVFSVPMDMQIIDWPVKYMYTKNNVQLVCHG